MTDHDRKFGKLEYPFFEDERNASLSDHGLRLWVYFIQLTGKPCSITGLYRMPLSELSYDAKFDRHYGPRSAENLRSAIGELVDRGLILWDEPSSVFCVPGMIKRKRPRNHLFIGYWSKHLDTIPVSHVRTAWVESMGRTLREKGKTTKLCEEEIVKIENNNASLLRNAKAEEIDDSRFDGSNNGFIVGTLKGSLVGSMEGFLKGTETKRDGEMEKLRQGVQGEVAPLPAPCADPDGPAVLTLVSGQTVAPKKVRKKRETPGPSEAAVELTKLFYDLRKGMFVETIIPEGQALRKEHEKMQGLLNKSKLKASRMARLIEFIFSGDLFGDWPANTHSVNYMAVKFNQLIGYLISWEEKQDNPTQQRRYAQ